MRPTGFTISPPTELMLFILRKLKRGATNVELVESDCGGDARKWLQALNWFLRRADLLIENHINLSLLYKYRDSIPTWARLMAERISRGFRV
jgi:hypothetical protein